MIHSTDKVKAHRDKLFLKSRLLSPNGPHLSIIAASMFLLWQRIICSAAEFSSNLISFPL